MSEKELQLEDTVSADRKERIIWAGPGKTRKISSITSRQNFDNEKFTRRKNKNDEDDEKEEVKESAVQTTGSSNIDTNSSAQSDTISKDNTKKKSNNSQIEFVTGTEKAASSTTAIGNAQNMGIKKISEAIVKKAITQIKVDKNVGTEEMPFSGPYKKTAETVTDKSGAKHTPMSRVRHLARQAMNNVKEETELDEKLNLKATEMGDVVKDFQQSDAPQFKGKSKEKRRQMAIAAKLQADRTNEGVEMSKTYKQFIEQLLEYESGAGGRYVHKGTYGGAKGAKYGNTDYDNESLEKNDDEETKSAAPAKRGRGRPAGSKSGANQKVTTGKSYGGIATHSLHLPNSK